MGNRVFTLASVWTTRDRAPLKRQPTGSVHAPYLPREVAAAPPKTLPTVGRHPGSANVFTNAHNRFGALAARIGAV
jgi:hypothetical protein